MPHWTDGLATTHRFELAAPSDPRPRLLALYWDAGRTVALVHDPGAPCAYWARDEDPDW